MLTPHRLSISDLLSFATLLFGFQPFIQDALKLVVPNIFLDKRARRFPAEVEQMQQVLTRSYALVAAPKLCFIDSVSHFLYSVACPNSVLTVILTLHSLHLSTAGLPY